MTKLLRLPTDTHQQLLAHLLPDDSPDEQAAFVYAHQDESGAELVYGGHDLLQPRDFEAQSSGYLELTDEARGRVIKRAHDENALLVEWHSHPYPEYPAAFSSIDRSGFLEFVPHVFWRLPGRPYAAVVVAPDGSFDALMWEANPREPEQLEGIVIRDSILRPTRRSLGRSYGWR